MADYEPGFCDPTNFSQEPSMSVGSTERFQNGPERFRNLADDPRGSGYYGNPWWTSDQPQHRHHGWEENTKFYELQAYRPDSAFAAPSPPKVRRAEEDKLAQLSIPRSYMDFYPNGVYTRQYGYGAYTDQLGYEAPEDKSTREGFTNGQAPWYVSSDPWYSTNYADNIAYGNYDSKRYQPIYRADAEARTQELAALYNNGTIASNNSDIALDNRRYLADSANPRNSGNSRNREHLTTAEYSIAAGLQGIPARIVAQIPAWCKGACRRRYAESLMRQQSGNSGTEHLVAGSPYTVEDKKKRILGF